VGLIQCAEETSESSTGPHTMSTGYYTRQGYVTSKQNLSQARERCRRSQIKPLLALINPPPSSLYEWILENPSLYFCGFFLVF